MAKKVHTPTAFDLDVHKKLRAVQEKYVGQPVNIVVARAAFIDVLRCFVGVSEIGTSNRGYWVDIFSAPFGTAIPWCAAFIQWALWFTGVKVLSWTDLLPHNTAGTQDTYYFAKRNKLVVYAYAETDAGDLTIWKDVTEPREPERGHIEAQTVHAMNVMTSLGGNTSSEFSRDGGDVGERPVNPGKWIWGTPAATWLAKNPKGRYVRGAVSFARLFAYVASKTPPPLAITLQEPV